MKWKSQIHRWNAASGEIEEKRERTLFECLIYIEIGIRIGFAIVHETLWQSPQLKVSLLQIRIVRMFTTLDVSVCVCVAQCLSVLGARLADTYVRQREDKCVPQ